MDLKDPVCGMDVEPDEAAGQSDFQGKTYYFCCNECKPSSIRTRRIRQCPNWQQQERGDSFLIPIARQRRASHRLTRASGF